MYITLKNVEILKKMALNAAHAVPVEKEAIVKGFKAYTRRRYNVRVQVTELTNGHLVETMVTYMLGILQQLRVVGYINVSAELDANQIDIAVNNKYFQLKYDHDDSENRFTEALYKIPVVGIPSVKRAQKDNTKFSEILIKMLLTAGVSLQVIRNLRCTTDVFEAADEIWQWIAK